MGLIGICDGVLDNDTECFDDDGDGYTEQGGDCDDGNAAVSPMAQEILDGLTRLRWSNR